MNRTQHLLDIASRLTPAKLAEVIDFAEYLDNKQSAVADPHALEALFGSLRHLPGFAIADSVEVQRTLRAEWDR